MWKLGGGSIKIVADDFTAAQQPSRTQFGYGAASPQTGKKALP
jgi:hypothetical protein